MKRLNRNYVDNNRLGDLTIINSEKNTQFHVASVKLNLAYQRSAPSNVPIYAVGEINFKQYSFAVNACELNWAQSYVNFEFPENYKKK